MTSEQGEIRVGPNDVLRFLIELFAFATFAIWGFAAWPMPWNIVLGIVTPCLAILVWALFRSPRAVLAVDAYVKAIVEIAVMASAAFCWWMLGQPVVAVAFALVATVSGLISGRKEFA